ncbi:MAG: hypothetical protein JW717_10145 [Marinilabiliaceae bacterium]|nr:hypothetical protein [Marinilabiliaceae bacterium]
MNNLLKLTIATFVFITFLSCQTQQKIDLWPDGTPISGWFKDTTKLDLSQLGQQFIITDFGAVEGGDSINTVAIQKAIDAASEVGGVVVIPSGTYLSGALFFKPGTKLHVQKGAVLKGSDDISNYPIQPSRMEGQNLDYFPALINAYNVNGFSISGNGTIDGNGLKYWEAFWQRRKENKYCTNLEVSRPRLVFIWGSNDVQIQDVKLHNSGFWTTHLYQCNNVKILNANIYAPKEPVAAPSSDAVDIDVCSNVLIKGCYMSVNDDAVTLKGGKGPWADEDPNNGPNMFILIEDNEYGWCHSVLTCGSESIHNRNVIMRNCKIDGASRMLFLKMRPDTPQKYEYITIENITGGLRTAIYIRPWRQFFDLQGRETPPVSVSENITFRNIKLNTIHFTEIGVTEYDSLRNFTLENIDVKAKEKDSIQVSLFDGIVLKNVKVNNKLLDL